MEEITAYVLIEDIAEMTTAALSRQVGGFVVTRKMPKTKVHPLIY